MNKTPPGRVSREFFRRPTLEVSRELIGKVLVLGNCAGIINETEAYIGQDDAASHASRGRTPRTEVMFGLAGVSYVYLIYGMYHCLNIVTEEVDFPAAVLIRSLVPTEGLQEMRKRRPGKGEQELCNGPGKLCQALGITKAQNKVDLCQDEEFYVRDGGVVPGKIEATSRVGIRLATDKKWRFVCHDIP